MRTAGSVRCLAQAGLVFAWRKADADGSIAKQAEFRSVGRRGVRARRARLSPWRARFFATQPDAAGRRRPWHHKGAASRTTFGRNAERATCRHPERGREGEVRGDRPRFPSAALRACFVTVFLRMTDVRGHPEPREGSGVAVAFGRHSVRWAETHAPATALVR